MTGVTPGLRALLGKLVAFKVTHWGSDSSAPDQTPREPVEDLNEAHVISSLMKRQPKDAHGFSDILIESGLNPDIVETRHQVAVDVDHPVHLVESSTPGHFHLYVEIPYGIEQSVYFEWLRASAKIGLLEPGYVEASIARGHSDLRLPWVTKAETPPTAGPLPLPLPEPQQPLPIPKPEPIFSAEHGPESGRPQSFDDIVAQQHNQAVARSGRPPAPGF
jgi:hypothetical protein